MTNLCSILSASQNYVRHINASPDVSGQLFIEPDQHFSAAFLACQQRHAARILRNVKMISDRKYLSFALCNPIDHPAPCYVIWMHNVQPSRYIVTKNLWRGVGRKRIACAYCLEAIGCKDAKSFDLAARSDQL
jgi:hypothetical protein